MTVSEQQTKSNKMKTLFLRLRGVEGAQAKPTCLQPGGGAESIDMKLSSFCSKNFCMKIYFNFYSLSYSAQVCWVRGEMEKVRKEDKENRKRGKWNGGTGRWKRKWRKERCTCLDTSILAPGPTSLWSGMSAVVHPPCHSTTVTCLANHNN